MYLPDKKFFFSDGLLQKTQRTSFKRQLKSRRNSFRRIKSLLIEDRKAFSYRKFKGLPIKDLTEYYAAFL